MTIVQEVNWKGDVKQLRVGTPFSKVDLPAQAKHSLASLATSICLWSNRLYCLLSYC